MQISKFRLKYKQRNVTEIFTFRGGKSMLPYQAERMQNKLIQMGFSARLVESMTPWALLRNYSYQLMKIERLKLSETKNEWETEKTYSGAAAPYRL